MRWLHESKTGLHRTYEYRVEWVRVKIRVEIRCNGVSVGVSVGVELDLLTHTAWFTFSSMWFTPL